MELVFAESGLPSLSRFPVLGVLSRFSRKVDDHLKKSLFVNEWVLALGARMENMAVKKISRDCCGLNDDSGRVRALGRSSPPKAGRYRRRTVTGFVSHRKLKLHQRPANAAEARL